MSLRAYRGVRPSASLCWAQPRRPSRFQPLPLTRSSPLTHRLASQRYSSSDERVPPTSSPLAHLSTLTPPSQCRSNFKTRRSQIGGWTVVFALLAGVATFREIFSDKDLPDLTYPPLDEFKDSIRVLTVLPGDWHNTVKCELNPITFSKNPDYEALSYAWGDSGETRKIQVNGTWVEVQENLYSALKHLRYTNASRDLWIDSLCLNQKDTSEKNKQIPLMAFIYQRAHNVIIWLGDHEPPFGVQSRLEHPEDWHDDSTRGRKSKTWSKIEPFIWKLAHEEYWKRTWIIQEIVMASRIAVYYGYRQLPWSDFITWINRYQHLNPRDDAIFSINRLEIMRQSRFTDSEQFSLKHLVHLFSDSFSTIAHDKIYAFLPMAYDHLGGGIPVDYNKPLAEVYRDVVRYFERTSLGQKQSIEMVFYSALTRQLLTRQSALRRKSDRLVFEDFENDATLPGLSAAPVQRQPNVDDRKPKRSTKRADQDNDHRANITSFGLSYNPTWVSEATHYPLSERTKSSALATEEKEAAKSKEEGEQASRYKMLLVAVGTAAVAAVVGTACWILSRERSSGPQEWFWHRDPEPENFSTWELPDNTDELFTLRGAVVGHIEHIGPVVHALTASLSRTKLWAAELSSHFPRGLELNRARGRNEKLITLLHNTQDFRTRNVLSLQSEHENISHSSITPSARVFIGSNTTIGVVPPNAKKGDIIVQFWNSTACVVLRENTAENEELRAFGFRQYEIIGRAAIVGDGRIADWDVPRDMRRFENNANGLDISVTLDQLTRLSLDTVNLSDPAVKQPFVKSLL